MIRVGHENLSFSKELTKKGKMNKIMEGKKKVDIMIGIILHGIKQN